MSEVVYGKKIGKKAKGSTCILLGSEVYSI